MYLEKWLTMEKSIILSCLKKIIFLSSHLGHHPFVLLLSILVIAQFFEVIFYNLYTYEVFFHSDSAFSNILVQEIKDSGSFFPPGMIYGNELWIWDLHLLFLPWLAIFGNSFFVHSLAGITNACLVAFVVIVLCRSVRISWLSLLFILSIIFSGISPAMGEYFFGQFCYGFMSSTIGFILFLVCRVIRSVEKQSYKNAFWALALICLLIILLVTQGIRGVLSYGGPLCVALLVFLFLETLQSDNGKTPPIKRSVFLTFGAILIGILIGFFLGESIRAQITVVNAAPLKFVSNLYELTFNLKLAANCLIYLVGAQPLWDSSLFSLPWLYAAYALTLFSMIMFFLPLTGLIHYKKIDNQYCRFLLVFYFISSGMTFYYFSFGKVGVNVQSSRYFVVFLFLAVILSGLLLDQHIRRSKKVFFTVFMALAPLYVTSYFVLVHPCFVLKNHKIDLVNALESRNIHYGYASFWNAHVLTVLSSFKTRINPVEINDWEGIKPMRWLSSEKWYEPDHYRGKTCIILTSSEYSSAKARKILKANLGVPEEQFVVHNYRVLVYGFNIAREMEWGIFSNERYKPEDLKVLLSSSKTVVKTSAGSQVTIPLKITNLGKRIFVSGGSYPIHIGAHLIGAVHDVMLNYDFLRATIPGVLKPNQTKEVHLEFTAPQQGRYILQIDLVQEGIAWFAQHGSKIVIIQMHVR
jgi:hypothetical protein